MAMYKKFIFFSIVGLGVPSALSVFIFMEANHFICFTDTCLKNAVVLYAFPIKVLEFSLGFLTLYLIFLGFKSTRETMEVTKTTNTFRDYIAHREAFFSLLAHHERELLIINNKDSLYRELFPENTPQEFVLTPDKGETSAFTITSIVSDFNSCVDGLVGAVNSCSVDHKEFARQLGEFMRIYAALGIAEKDCLTVSGAYSGMVNTYSQVVREPSKSLHALKELLKSIEHFCTKDKSERSVSGETYSLQESLDQAVIVITSDKAA